MDSGLAECWNILKEILKKKWTKQEKKIVKLFERGKGWRQQLW